MRRKWTQIEEDILKAFYYDLSLSELSTIIKRTNSCIASRVRKLNLCKNSKKPESYKKICSERNYELNKKGVIKFFSSKNNPSHDPECLRKMSETKKRRYKEGKIKPSPYQWKKGHKTKKPFPKGHIPHNKGKTKKNYKPLMEVSKKMSIHRKGRKMPVKDTSIEVKIQNFLKTLGIEFFTHQYIKIKNGYQCDIFIPSINLIIECDGDYWHNYPIGYNIDLTRSIQLLMAGYKILRLWEHEIKKMDLNKFEGILIDKEKHNKFINERYKKVKEYLRK